LLRREKHREALTYHQFGLDFAGPDAEVKPFENQMYSESSDRQIPPLKISNLQWCWLRGFSNGVPKAGGVDDMTGEARIKAGCSRKEDDEQEPMMLQGTAVSHDYNPSHKSDSGTSAKFAAG
jgi:hypothetical protein